MEKGSDPKDHTLIEIIKPPPQPLALEPSLFTECGDEDQRAPFFRHVAGKNKYTWIVSLFIFFHIIAFSVTMIVNDCWHVSHGDCALKSLGRFSFQPLSENPLLGPSASTLDEMGALRQTFLREHHQTWRLFAFLWLHAGVIHIVINLTSLVFIGVHLEQEFGPLRIGLIYGLSALSGGLVAALFVLNSPAVGSSCGLFGLLGAMLAAIIRNWNYYSDKFVTLSLLIFVAMINLGLGLLPYINNFSNMGGLVSGFCLGFVLLYNPQLIQECRNKKGLFDYGVKRTFNFKQQLDKPVLRIAFLILFSLLLGGVLVAFLHGIDGNRYCSWCQYIDCVPSRRWICNDKGIPCETMEGLGQITLTCTGNGNFRILRYTNISEARKGDLCNLICS